MRRREVIVGIAGASVAWPLAVRAQQPGKVPKIGFLYPGPVAASTARIDAILAGLREVGYRESRQVELLSRIADGNSTKLSTLAEELVRREVDLIIAVSTAAIRMAQAATATTTPIPIIGHELARIARLLGVRWQSKPAELVPLRSGEGYRGGK